MRKRSLILISLYASGWWLGGLKPGLSDAYGSLPLFGVWLAFLGWLGGLIGWGVWWTRRLRFEFPGFAEYTALGAAFYALTSGALALSGCLGPGWAWVFHLLVISGCIFISAIPPFLDPQNLLRIRRDEPWAILCLGVVLLVVYACANRLQLLQDVFTVHLYGPELWWRLGRLEAVPWHPFVFQTGIWDYLNFYGLALYSRSFGTGLISTQFFAQLVSAVLGTGGFLLVLYRIAGFCLRERAWAYLILLVGLVLEPLLWTSWTAKHDFGACFWGFAGLLLLLPISSEKSRIGLGAFFLGLAAATKVTLLPWLAGTGIAWAIARSLHYPWVRTSREIFVFAGAATLALLPQVLRNFYFVEIPLFPIEIGGWRSSQIAETHREFLEGRFPASPLPARGDFRAAWQALVVGAPEWLVGVVVGIVVWWRFPRSNFGFFSLAVVLASLLYWLVLGGQLQAEHALRLTAPAIIGARLLLVAACANLIYGTRLADRPAIVWGRAAIVIVWVALSFIPWNALWEPKPDPALVINEQLLGGQCKLWLNRNVAPSNQILFINDDNLYYTSGTRVSVGFHDPKVDTVLRSGSPPAAVFRQIRDLGFRFVVDDFGQKSTTFFLAIDDWRHWLVAQKKAVAYRGKDCAVLDLDQASLIQ